jgi:hypothetical protein
MLLVLIVLFGRAPGGPVGYAVSLLIITARPGGVAPAAVRFSSDLP